MPKNSRDSTLQELERLLKAVRENEAILTGIAPFLDALERAYNRALANRRIRNAMRDSMQEATQCMNQSLAAGKDAAICIRSIIRGVLGHRSQELPRFGIKPRRKRSPSGKRPPLGFELPS
jgi:hypothetical protein